MKNTNFMYLIILLGTVLASCAKEQNKMAQPFLTEKLNAKSAKFAQEYSKNDTKIEVSPNGLLYNNYKKLADEDKGKIRAAAYRFYKHVKTENGKLNVLIKNGKEINISDELFNTLNKNIEQSNRFLDSLNKKGVQVTPPVITADYLNGLINN